MAKPKGARNIKGNPLLEIIRDTRAFLASLTPERASMAATGEALFDDLEEAKTLLEQAAIAVDDALKPILARHETMEAETRLQRLIVDQASELERQAAEIEELKKQLRITGNGDKVTKSKAVQKEPTPA